MSNAESSGCGKVRSSMNPNSKSPSGPLLSFQALEMRCVRKELSANSYEHGEPYYFLSISNNKDAIENHKGQDYFDDIKSGAFVFASYKLKTPES